MYVPIYTLLPHVECTIMTVYSHNIPYYYIYRYIITRQNVNYLRISCF